MPPAPHDGTAEVFGLVLAGGRSRRFGRDKAAVTVAGLPLLDRTVGLLEELLSGVYVSVRSDQQQEPVRSRHRMIPDGFRDMGPLAGILSAHRQVPQVAWLVVACDMPWLDRPTLEELLRQRDPARAATAYASAEDGLPEPLCAVYEPATLARFTRQVEAGAGPGARELLLGVDTRLVPPPDGRSLFNMNTPARSGQLA